MDQDVVGRNRNNSTTSITIWCYNKEVIALSSNLTHYITSKHIGMNYHFVRKKMVAKSLDDRFVCSKDQQADLLTKALPRSTFSFLFSKLTSELLLSLRGRIDTHN